MRKITFALFALVLFALGVSAKAEDQSTDSKIARFAKAYQDSKTELQKRTLCLQAIDDGLFKQGDSIKVIDRLFGTNYANYFMGPSEEKQGAVIYFAAQPIQQNPDRPVQMLGVGWYFVVTYDKERIIRNYYLSNLHDKDLSLWQ